MRRPIALVFGLIFTAALLHGIGIDTIPSHYRGGAVKAAGLLRGAEFVIFTVSYFSIVAGPAIRKRAEPSA